MKNWMLAGLILFLFGLTGCTATIYGVPQERWDAMGEQERAVAIETYRARQAALQQQREERARQQALERERQRAIEAQEARQRQLRIDAIYRGEGTYSDLLRVTVRDGMLKLKGTHKRYQPFAFKIAAGETKMVPVVDLGGKKANMTASYDGSTLLLDDNPGAKQSRAARLIYEDRWEDGKTYSNLNAKGPLELRGVTVTVQVLGEPPRERHAGRSPQVIIIQQPAPPENSRGHVDREKEHPAGKPVTVIVQAPPGHDRAETAVKGPPRQGKPEIADKMPPRNGRQVAAKEEFRNGRPEAAGKDVSRDGKPEAAAKVPPRSNKPEIVARELPSKKQPNDAPPSRVKVTFSRGQIRIKGRNCPIVPQSIDLREGEIRTIALQGQLGKVNVRISYRGGEIAIDDHPGKGKPDTRLSFSQAWRAGSTYRIETTESRLIENLDISVRAL